MEDDPVELPVVLPVPVTEEDVALPLEELPLVDALLGDELPLEDPPLDELPLDELPLEELPLDELPLEELPLDGLPLEELPLDELPLVELPVEEPPPDLPPEVPTFRLLAGAEWQTSSLPQTRPAGQPWAWQSGSAGIGNAQPPEANSAARAQRLTT